MSTALHHNTGESYCIALVVASYELEMQIPTRLMSYQSYHNKLFILDIKINGETVISESSDISKLVLKKFRSAWGTNTVYWYESLTSTKVCWLMQSNSYVMDTVLYCQYAQYSNPHMTNSVITQPISDTCTSLTFGVVLSLPIIPYDINSAYVYWHLLLAVGVWAVRALWVGLRISTSSYCIAWKLPGKIATEK